MGLMDVTPLSLGIETLDGISLRRSIASVLIANISARERSLHVSCISRAGDEILVAELDVGSQVIARQEKALLAIGLEKCDVLLGASRSGAFHELRQS